MTRSERLLALLQVLRRHRRPVSGNALASETGVSIRTLYRDIAALQAQGAPIEGEAGVGYVLKPGYMLPPLMFSREEIEALALGARWVEDRGDERLAAAASDALAKISAVLPADLREELETSALLVGPGKDFAPGGADLSVVREAIRAERKLSILYADADGSRTRRVIWPFALGFFERTRILVAWCELRVDYRHFRADRIFELEATTTRFPRRRQALMKEWRAKQNIPPAP